MPSPDHHEMRRPARRRHHQDARQALRLRQPKQIGRHQDLLRLYREVVDPGHTYTLIGEAELVSRGLATHARSNCILASPRLAELGITMRPVDEALRATMTAYAANVRSVASAP